MKSQSYGISLRRNATISGEGTLNIDSEVFGILCTAADDNINLTIRDASVYSKGYAWGINGDIASSLTFENANVTAEGSRYGGIGNINNGITLVGCSIVDPANASIEDGFVKSGNEFAKKVVIAPDSKPWLKGDVNEDGTVDISDVVAVINQMAGTASGLRYRRRRSSIIFFPEAVIPSMLAPGRTLKYKTCLRVFPYPGWAEQTRL